MRIIFKTTNTTLTPSIKSYAEKKFLPLGKHIAEGALVRVELELLKDHKEKNKFRAEANIDAPHHVFRAESREKDLYAAIDTLVPKLVSQSHKFSDRITSVLKKKSRELKREIEESETV